MPNLKELEESATSMPVVTMDELFADHVNCAPIACVGKQSMGKTMMILNFLYTKSPTMKDLVIFSLSATKEGTESPFTGLIPKECFVQAKSTKICAVFSELMREIDNTISTMNKAVKTLVNLELAEHHERLGQVFESADVFEQYLIKFGHDANIDHTFDSLPKNVKVSIGLGLWSRCMYNISTSKLVELTTQFNDASNHEQLRSTYEDSLIDIKSILQFLSEGSTLPVFIFDDCTEIWQSTTEAGTTKEKHKIYDLDTGRIVEEHLAGYKALEKVLGAFFTRGRHFAYSFFALHKMSGFISGYAGQFAQVSCCIYNKSAMAGINKTMNIKISALRSYLREVEVMRREISSELPETSDNISRMYHPMIVTDTGMLNLTPAQADQMYNVAETINEDEELDIQAVILRSIYITKQDFIEQSMNIIEPLRGTEMYEKLVHAMRPYVDEASGLQFSPIIIGSIPFRIKIIKIRELMIQLTLEKRQIEDDNRKLDAGEIPS